MNRKVTVYIPNHNYEKYFSKAIQSVLDQSYENWELILILDGCTDNSVKIAKKYLLKNKSKIRLFVNKKNKGLQFCCNQALKHASGEYILRLDADDFLNENALLLMSRLLDKNKKLNLVFSDYFYVDEKDKILDVNTHTKIKNNNHLLNIPAHGAGSMVRISKLKKLGGYSTSFNAQDGYELWLKILSKNSIGNITTPLFYYRQHPKSLSKDENRILEARRKIKRKFALKNKSLKKLKIAAVIGAKNNQGWVYRKFKNRFLIDYILSAALKTKSLGKILVSTDDKKIQQYCKNKEKVFSYIRPKNFSNINVTIEEVCFDALKYLKKKLKYKPDLLVFLNCNTPLTQSKHIQKAIDSLILFDSDSVISVYEDYDLHYQHGETGLKKISNRRHQQLRIDREALYVDNRAIRVCKAGVMKKNDMTGNKVGHIVMPREISINIKSEYDVWLINKYLSERY